MDKINIYLNVLHLHLIQFLLLVRGVAVHEVLSMRGDSYLPSLFVGRSWKCAVGHLGVMALIGKVTEPFILKQKASVWVKQD